MSIIPDNLFLCVDKDGKLKPQTVKKNVLVYRIYFVHVEKRNNNENEKKKKLSGEGKKSICPFMYNIRRYILFFSY